MNKVILLCAALLTAAGVAQAQALKENFKVEAASIGNPATDGVCGTITDSSGGNFSYSACSINGTWWMTQNAAKPLTVDGDGCTHPSLDRGDYGHLYSWSCAQKACPTGWSLPTDKDFRALEHWLTVHSDEWSEWNAGFALSGYGFNGIYYGGQGLGVRWWTRSEGSRFWSLSRGVTSGVFLTYASIYSFGVRCVKK
jgi:uncharacterized protein (TIGR02145 family)